MPWRNSGLIQEFALVVAISWAVVMGFIAKVAVEVKSGERDKFFTRRLLLDLPAVIAMSIVAAGLNVWLELDGLPATAVAVVCGWVGPRSIDIILMAVADRVRGGDK